MLVDAHTHVACGDDPRFPTRPTGVASDWWRHGGTVDELMAELDAAGVDHCVVVQAIGAYAHECGCAAHSVAEHPGRLALVASIDMDVERPRRRPRRAGRRARRDPGRHPAVRRRWRRAGCGCPTAGPPPCGTSPPTWAPPSCRACSRRHLPALAEVIEGRPEVPVALDHCAFPDMGEEGEAAVLRLADLPEVHLKVTSYVLEMAERDEGDPARHRRAPRLRLRRQPPVLGLGPPAGPAQHLRRQGRAGPPRHPHPRRRRPRRRAGRHRAAPLVPRLTAPPRRPRRTPLCAQIAPFSGQARPDLRC